MSLVLTVDPLLPGPLGLLRPWAMSLQCKRFATSGGNTQVKVKADASVLDPLGIVTDTAHLNDAICSCGPAIVMAHSRGGQLVGRWLEEHADDPDAPDPDLLSFIVFGNPERGTAHGGRGGGKYLDGSPLRDTPNTSRYRVLDVARRGDYFAQPVPDINTVAAQFIHCWYLGVDLRNPDVISRETVGNTTYLVVS